MKPAPARRRLRDAALAYPGAYEEFPWGEPVIKVAKKIFFFAGADKEGGLGISCKLPHSSEAALSMFSFARPTPYNLGKSGWVSAQFGKADDVPLGLLLEWLDESYRAVAPKKLVKALAPLGQAPATTARLPAKPARRPAKKAPAQKAAAKAPSSPKKRARK